MLCNIKPYKFYLIACTIPKKIVILLRLIGTNQHNINHKNTTTMKKVFLFLALAIPMMASAQLMEVTSAERVTASADAKVAAFSPNGDYLLLTNTSNQGLQRFDLATKQVATISKADGAGYNVQIYNRQNELYIFLKRKVHLFSIFRTKMSNGFSSLLIFYNRAFFRLFQRLFNIISSRFQYRFNILSFRQIQCKSVEPQKPFSNTNQA